MIDTNQLSALVSAFRVETEKSAIKRAQCKACLSIAEREQIMQRKYLARTFSSTKFALACRQSRCKHQANLCQTVGKLLQDILDLLKNASTDAERKVLDDWKHRASRTQSQARLNYAGAAGNGGTQPQAPQVVLAKVLCLGDAHERFF